MPPPISRRDFLKLSCLSLGTLAFRPLAPLGLPWPPDDAATENALKIMVRITLRSIYIYREPDFRSPRIGTIGRDNVLHIPEEIVSPHGPSHNPRWYRLVNGYIHSGYTQRVENAHFNEALRWVPRNGRLGEISVPFTQSYRKTLTSGWVKLYRLYFGSMHWITDIVEGPDGETWYILTDELLHVNYGVPAAHVRPLHPTELAPISPDVPEEEKRIEVSKSDQYMVAYEGDQPVFETKISTGIPSKELPPNGIPTETPQGRFRVGVKVPSKHMGDGTLSPDLDAYELIGVPWVSFFHKDGIAFHGTYWHDNFGRMMSHGCINMRNQDAKWLYRWSAPFAEASDWNRKGIGTVIRIT
jgi:hypothetical protein